MKKLVLPIKGMHCKSCELLIEGNLKEVKGVAKVDVSHTSGKAKVWYESTEPSYGAMCKAVEEAGYTVGSGDKKLWFSRNPRDYYYVINAAAILLMLFIAIQMTGFGNVAANVNSQSVGLAVVVGLIAGISSCMALIGGLVLGFSSRYAEQHPEATVIQKFRPHLFFNLGRVIGFAALGGLMGLVGSALQPSARMLAVLTIAVGIVMVLLGLKLIELFPVLDRVNLTLPKFISRALGIRTDVAEYSHRGAFLAGVLTFFLPCGFTQAMQLYAVSTGSFVQGALIMSLFAIGTAPGLLTVGGLSSAFKGTKAKLFFATAGLAVVLLGALNITNAGRIVFPGKIKAVAETRVQTTGPVHEIRMTQSGTGYSPNQFMVKKGETVRWIINSTNRFTCASSLSVPAYGINRALKSGENVIEFTPTEAGDIAFSCSMGMFRGKITVTD